MNKPALIPLRERKKKTNNLNPELEILNFKL